MTCAGARPFKQQRLGSKYYIKEHTKPIFSRLKILTVQGLFKYHCIAEIFKIVQSRTPYPLYEAIAMSQRDTSNVIILPVKSNSFLYIAAQLWNSVHKRILSEKGMCTSVNLVKLRVKHILLESQCSGDVYQWNPQNFQIPHHSHSLQQHSNIKEEDQYIISVI